MAPLQCFRSELYASFAECEKVPGQCIAPTAKFTRCLLSVRKDNQAAAARLRDEVEALPEGDDRSEKIQEYVLLHCCNRHHRPKLEDDDTGCLTRIAKAYGAHMGKSRSPVKQKDLPPVARMVASRTDSVKTETTAECQTPFGYMRVTKVEERSVRRTLELVPQFVNTVPESTPSRSTSSKVTEPFIRCGAWFRDPSPSRHVPDEAVDMFVRYKTGPHDSIRNVLLTGIPSSYTANGTVYSFTWPTHPGFIKIGYTKGSAESRLAQWQSCHPGATLTGQEAFDFPRRIERLIHLQMAEHRYRIKVCHECGSSHIEWFKQSADDVSKVIQEWKKVMTREPLYGSDRHLTESWRARISASKGTITAKALLDLLDAEAAAMEADRKKMAADTQERRRAKSNRPEATDKQKSKNMYDSQAWKDFAARVSSELPPGFPFCNGPVPQWPSGPMPLADKTNTSHMPTQRLIKLAA